MLTVFYLHRFLNARASAREFNSIYRFCQLITLARARRASFDKVRIERHSKIRSGYFGAHLNTVEIVIVPIVFYKREGLTNVSYILETKSFLAGTILEKYQL